MTEAQIKELDKLKKDRDDLTMKIYEIPPQGQEQELGSYILKKHQIETQIRNLEYLIEKTPPPLPPRSKVTFSEIPPPVPPREEEYFEEKKSSNYAWIAYLIYAIVIIFLVLIVLAVIIYGFKSFINLFK